MPSKIVMNPTPVVLIAFIQAVTCAVDSSQLGENDDCIPSAGASGKCLLIDNCASAKWILSDGERPLLCGFKGKTPIVCCENELSKPVSIATKKCLEYKTKSTRISKRSRLPTFGIFGGSNVERLEFPHMAILGYGNGDDKEWSCGGALISENFVLTAAHCIHSRLGNVSAVKLGVHHKYNTPRFVQSFTVKKVYLYPNYSRTQSYHDVALIELDRPAALGVAVRPACLHTSTSLPSTWLTATGWGLTEIGGTTADILQKVKLYTVSHDLCATYYQNRRTLTNGLIEEWHICADGRGGRADTCEGDSGGPLHLPFYRYSEHIVVGITSTGLSCAAVPAVYTRVAHYVPWIESIVWPGES